MAICFYITLLLGPSLMVGGYYLFWATAGRLGRVDAPPPTSPPTHRLLILVPAHNEAGVLGELLASCHAADYPAELLQIVVVADHCSDETSEIARRAGVCCWERTEGTGSKPAALAWAADRLLHSPHWDACVVVDADCTITPQSLRTTDSLLSKGCQAIQWSHHAVNADQSPIAYAAAVGRTLEYELLFAPKSAAAWPIALVGTGMVLSRSVATRLNWSSSSPAEDTEYTLQLAELGQRVVFSSHAAVEIHAAENHDQLRIQRCRWASGNLGGGHRMWQRMWHAACQARAIWPLDLAFMIATRSRPLLLAHLALTVTVGVFAFAQQFFLAALSVLMVHGAYYALGVAHFGLSWRRLRLLGQTPWVVFRLTAIALEGLITGRHHHWQKTPRPASQKPDITSPASLPRCDQ